MANIALITNNILSDSGTALTSVITGSGTTNYLSKFTGSTALGNSLVYDDGTFVGIGTTTPTYKLDVNGTTRVSSTTAASSLVFTSTTSSIATASVKVDTIGGFFRAYGSAFSVASLASKVSFGPDGANGIVVFSNPTQASGSTGSISLRGGGYDTAAEMLFIDQNGSRFTNGYVLIGTSTNAGYKLDVNGTARINSTLSVTNSAYTGGGSFYQAANVTTVIAGGPASENITFGPSNRIFINAQQTRIAGGSLQIASTLTAGSLTATSTSMIWANGSITAGSNIARGIYTDTTLVASANNDVLVGVDIAPTFTNGAFTGLTNVDLRTKNAGVVVGSNYGYGANYGYTSDGIVQIQAGGTGILGSTFSTQMVFRPSGNATSFNGNYWSYIEQSTGGLLITSARYQNLYLRASTNSAASADLYLQAGSNTIMLLKGATSNVLIGTTTDAGYRLDVNGTARVQYGTVERGVIFTHSNGTYAEIVLGNGSAAGVGVVEIHRNGTSAISLRSNAVLFNTSRLVTPSTFFVNGPYGGSNIGTSVRLASNTVDQGVYTATSGTQSTVVIGNSGNEIWQPSSGTATYNLFSVLPSINTSGTYAGIVRGFYYSPTLTSITGVTHRAIETVTGDIYFASTSGNVGIGTAPTSSYKLDVNGTARVQGQLEVLSNSSTNGILLKHTALSTTATQIYYNSSDAVTYLDTLFSYTASQPFGSVNIRTKDSLNALTSRLYVEGNSGNVGIGTTTFLGKFQVGSGSATQFQVASSGASIYVGPSSGNYNMNITTNTIQSSNSGTTNTYLYIQPNGTGNVAMCSSGTNKVLIGTTTDAGFKLDVNGTARVQGVITGSVSSGSLTLGAAAANSQAITITGYFTGNGAISIANSNPRSFNTNLGGQGYGYSTSYNSVAQNQTATNTYFSATGNINLTDGAIDLNGFNFNPTIISETGATIKAFSSGLNAASNRWNLYINGTAKNYLAGNLLIGSTTDSGEKLQVNGSGNFNLGNSGYIKLQSGSGQRHGFVQSAFSNFLFSNNVYFDGSNWRYDQNGYGAQIQTETLSVGVIAFNTFASGTGGSVATIIESMRIANSGNILMGDPNDYGFKLQVNGTSIFSDTIIQDYGNNSNASRGITSYIAQSNLTNDYVNGYYSGETISGELASTVVAGQVVAMKANSLQWELADASTAASIGKNMLGIACYGGNSTDVITILLNGFFASNTYYGNSGNYGVPMYLNASTNGSLTDVAPSTTGNIVRIVGHIDNYSNSNGCAVVRFNPDNFWLVI